MIKRTCDGCGHDITPGTTGGLPILLVDNKSGAAVRFSVVGGDAVDLCNSCVNGRVMRWAESIIERRETCRQIGDRATDVRCVVLDLQEIMRMTVAGKIGRDRAVFAICKKVDELAEYLL